MRNIIILYNPSFGGSVFAANYLSSIKGCNFYLLCPEHLYESNRFLLDKGVLKGVIATDYTLESLSLACERIQKDDGQISEIIYLDEDCAQLAGILRQRYGLSDKNLDNFTDKWAMYVALKESGVKVPQTVLFESNRFIADSSNYIKEIESKLGEYPYFAKPRNSSGSRGVEKIKSPEDLIGWGRVIHDNNYIIQEYIEGDLYHCESIVCDGEIIKDFAFRYSNPGQFFSKGLTVGSISLNSLDPIKKDMLEFNARVLTALGQAENCVTQVEVYLDKNEDLVFLEAAARPPGLIGNILYRKHIGYALTDIHLRLQLGDIKKEELNNISIQNYSARVLFPFKQSGIVKERNLLPELQSEYIEAFNYKSGDSATKSEDFFNTAGSMVLWNRDYEALVRDYEVLSAYQPYAFESKTGLPINIQPKCISKPIDSRTLIELFEECVDRYSARIALSDGDEDIAYSLLQKKVGEIAQLIATIGIAREEFLIPLFLERKSYMIASILGVLKAGGAYVPIDLSSPVDRIVHILSETKASILITDKANEGFIKDCIEQNGFKDKIVVLVVDSLPDEDRAHEHQIDFRRAKKEDLAYVIYTSGTTGVPKGVMVEHQGVVNLVDAQAQEFGLSETKRKNCLLFSNYAFDAHVSEVFTALLNGHTLYIVDEDLKKDIEGLREYVRENSIQVATITPAVLSESVLLPLETLVVAGETPSKALFDAYFKNGTKVINAYGPSEGTVCSTLRHYDGFINANNIGWPIQNTFALVVDEDGPETADDDIGELCIGGANLARGYLNNPKLTEAKFISGTKRLYRTGDLVRRLNDGSFEFLGRKDSQVKVRGHRVELEEIKSHLEQFLVITKALVVLQPVQEGGQKEQLVAYYVSDIEIHEKVLDEYLRAKIPEYMVPLKFHKVDTFPVNRNGKIDKEKLIYSVSGTNKALKVAQGSVRDKICLIFSDILKIERHHIDSEASFYGLGGDSITVMKLVSVLNKEFNIGLSVQDIMLSPAIKDIEGVVLGYLSNKPGKIFDQESLCIEKSFPANSMQRGFIYDYLSNEQKSSAYHMQLLWSYGVEVDVDALKEAWQCVLDEQPGLRIRLSWDEEASQIIEDDVELNWSYFDYTFKGTEQASESIDKFLKKDLGSNFQLDKGPLLRVALIKVGHGKFYSVLSNHHVIIDGWSVPLILKGVHEKYFDIVSGKNAQKSVDQTYKKAIQYESELEKDSEDFWRNYLKIIDEGDPLYLLTNSMKKSDLNKNAKQFEFNESSLVINSDLLSATESYGRRNNVTLNSVLQYTWHKCLNIFTRGSQTIVGNVLSGRNKPIEGIDQAIGMFVKTAPVVVEHTLTGSSLDLIKKVHSDMIEITEHSNICLSDFSKDGDRLFNSIYVYENHPYREGLFSKESGSWQSELKFKVLKSAGHTDYPLCLSIVRSNNSLDVKLSFNQACFCEHRMASILETFKNVLASIVNGDTNYGRKELLLENLPQLQRHEDLATEFLKTSEQYSDNTAIVGDKEDLTYQQLDQYTNELSSYLRDKIDAVEYIGVLVKSSADFVKSIVSVVKAGGAYVPLDLNMPDARLVYIFKSISLGAIIIDSANRSRVQKLLKECDLSPLIVDIDEFTGYACSCEHNIEALSDGESEACVMFTSGSTGTPKGVIIRHEGIVSLVKNVDYIDIKAGDGFIQLSNPAFDASTLEIWGALLNGGRLVCLDNRSVVLESCEKLKCILVDNKVDHLWLTKSVFDYIYKQDSSAFESLETLLIGGEALNYDLVRALAASDNRPKKIVNGYGPTENTTFSCTYTVDTQMLDQYASVPIGKALPNRIGIILDDELSCVPAGAIGTLYLGGAGLAKGYLNEDPGTFTSKVNSIDLYNSGDLVRLLSDGNIEYVGRVDKQVKLNGNRIDLIEVEQMINKFPGIDTSAVVVKEDSPVGEKMLVACLATSSNIDEVDLQGYLKNLLPAYMVPSRYIVLGKLPLNSNGKVDARIISELCEQKRTNSETAKKGLERDLSQIWAEVLNINIENIGLDDDFFLLGGNSLLCIKLLVEVNKYIARELCGKSEITLPQLLKSTTVRDLATYLKGEYMRGSSIAQFRVDTQLRLNGNLPKEGAKQDSAILLTGATGLLGAHILFNLVKSNSRKIVCVVRAGSKIEAQSKLEEVFQKYFSDVRIDFSNQVEVVLGDLSKPKLDIDPILYERLEREVGIVIHNGAEVNHIYPYELLREANTLSTKELLAFCSSKTLKQFNFVSTLSILEYKDSVEKINGDDLDKGYIFSKLGSEMLINEAREYELPVNIFRPGLIFAESNSRFMFESNNHFYSYISGILQLGKCPQIDKAFDIAPVSFVAEQISNIALDGDTYSKNYDFTIPGKVSLYDIVDTLNDSGFKVEITSMQEWGQLLENLPADNNLYKFLSIYKGQQGVKSTTKAKCDPFEDSLSSWLEQKGCSYPNVSVDALVKGILDKSEKVLAQGVLG